MSRRPGETEENEAVEHDCGITIIDQVGEIKQVGTTVRVGVRLELQPQGQSRSEWVERTRWNEVTIFGNSARGYVRRNIVKGDLVFTSARWAKQSGRRTGGRTRRHTRRRTP